MHFRADSIVRDAELIRRELIGKEEPWSVLGQSYGGFCAVHYLSSHPHGLREVFITGGVPPLEGSADDYYRHTYPEVQRKTRNFFARYPADRDLCADHGAPAPEQGRTAHRRPSHGPPLSAGWIHARVRRRHGESPLPARERVLHRRKW
jgi:pimeloyl-ACP methyl ester carboxylesterase